MARHPTLDVYGALFDLAGSSVCATRLVTWEIDVELGVIGIHMICQVVFSKYGSKWHAVDGNLVC